jgi:hypothetical protein
VDHPRLELEVIAAGRLRAGPVEITPSDVVLLWGDVDMEACKNAGIVLPDCTLRIDEPSLGQVLSRAASSLATMN